MKAKEELTALKEEVEALNRKLAELSSEELEQVVGGAKPERNGNALSDDALNNVASIFIGNGGNNGCPMDALKQPKLYNVRGSGRPD